MKAIAILVSEYENEKQRIHTITITHIHTHARTPIYIFTGKSVYSLAHLISHHLLYSTVLTYVSNAFGCKNPAHSHSTFEKFGGVSPDPTSTGRLSCSPQRNLCEGPGVLRLLERCCTRQEEMRAREEG